MSKLKEFLRLNPEVIICEICFSIYLASVIYYYITVSKAFENTTFIICSCCFALLFIPMNKLFLIFHYRYKKPVFLIFYYLSAPLCCTPVLLVYLALGPSFYVQTFISAFTSGLSVFQSDTGGIRIFIECMLSIILFFTMLEAIIRNAVKYGHAKRKQKQSDAGVE